MARDLVHVLRLRKVTGGREEWMDNLGEQRQAPDQEDMNADLRREAEEARDEILRRENSRKEKISKKEKKEDEKSRKKKREVTKPRGSSGKKDLTSVYGGTGLDPDPAVRKLTIRKARRIRKRGRKKKKRSSSSKSMSSSTSSSSSSMNLVDTEIFEGEKVSHKLWKRTPGALSLATIIEAQQTLLTRQGVHPDVHSGQLPPIMVQYYRANLQPTMGPALSRESHHWAMLVDLLVQGEIARGCDLACQRLKSLESFSKGVALDVSRHLELVPQDKASLTTATEQTVAGKIASEEQKLHSKTRYPGKGAESSYGAPGRKKGKVKGDGKKGKGDHKGNRKGKDEDKEKTA